MNDVNGILFPPQNLHNGFTRELLRPISSRTALRRDRLRLKIALPDGTGTFRPPATSLSRFPGTSAGPQTRADGGRPEVLISVLTPAGASTIMRE
jgi:hypothetical protein